MAGENNLRVTFIAGGLNKGGAEKQFLYMLRALRELGAETQVITLTQGEYYEDILKQLEIEPVYAGSNSATRMAMILKKARTFNPHFFQASHFFASFYAGMAGRISGVCSIGAIRSDLYLDLEGVGKAGPWLLKLPSAWLANSLKARANASSVGLPTERVHVLHNVIDLEEFDRRSAGEDTLLSPDFIYMVTVARLVPIKRLERFLAALALARVEIPNLIGLIVGDGPLAAELRAVAQRLDLQPDHPTGGVRFLGERNDIPHLLEQADIFILTSDREGFPNVLLEAMAASLPIITTPAGETSELVVEGLNGYFVPFDDPQALARRIVELAMSPALRQKMGIEGHRIVERRFSYTRLKISLIETYQAIAQQARSRAAFSILENRSTSDQENTLLVSERRDS